MSTNSSISSSADPKKVRSFTPSAPTMTIEECLFGPDNQQQQQQPRVSRRRYYPNNDHVIDIVQLRKLAAQGMDGEVFSSSDVDESEAGTGAGTGHRALTWRVLLGYLPKETNQWKSALEHHRDLYTSLCHELFYFQNGQQDIDGKQLQRHNHEIVTKESERRKQQQLTDELEDSEVFEEEEDDEPELILPTEENNNNNDAQQQEQQQQSSSSPDDKESSAGVEDDGETTTTTATGPDGRPSPTKQQSINYDKFYNLSKHNKHKSKKINSNDNDEIDFNELNLGTLTKRQKEVLERLSQSLAINKLKIKNEEWNNFMENSSLLDEIRKDVIRTHPDLYFFLEPNQNLGQKRYAALERILFIWAKLNKGVRYVQGMNEIVGTLYFVLANDFHSEWASYAEADTYVIFNILMSDMRDVFVPDMDDADTGIQGRISNMQELLGIHDPEVRYHLDDCGIDASFYAVRWLTTLLSREFLLPDTIRLWDSMFASTHKENFLRYVCVTMVILIRHQLIRGDFSTCLRLLQAYPPNNMDQLLESSRALWIYESQIMAACHRGGVTLQQALQAISPPPSIIMAFGLRGGVIVSSGSTITDSPNSGNNNNNNHKNRSQMAKNVVQNVLSSVVQNENSGDAGGANSMNSSMNSDMSGENKGFLSGARRLWTGWSRRDSNGSERSNSQHHHQQQQQEQQQQQQQPVEQQQQQQQQQQQYQPTVRSSPRSRFWNDGASGGVARGNQYTQLKKSSSYDNDDGALPFNEKLMAAAAEADAAKGNKSSNNNNTTIYEAAAPPSVLPTPPARK